MRNIIFYGPVGKKDGSKIGGGESGSKRTIKLLKERGFNVIILPKPYPTEIKLFKPFFPVALFSTYLKLLLLTSNTKSPKIFHITGFYDHLIYFEWLFVTTAFLFNIPVIYEIRGGRAIESYKTRSGLYRLLFKSTIKRSSCILCQGADYLKFVSSISKTKAFYYPNYILKENFSSYNDNCRSKNSSLKLIYFGRIVPSKNIDFIIKVCDAINQNGINFCLEIIGDSNGNEEYHNKITRLINDFDLKDKIKITKAVPSKELFKILQTKHFFIFPTVEKREGHSNSLTEAMSFGVVPVVSDTGFNRSIVQNDNLVIESFNPLLYANTIIRIWHQNLWTDYSKKMYWRIEKHFTQEIVEETLFMAYDYSNK